MTKAEIAKYERKFLKKLARELPPVCLRALSSYQFEPNDDQTREAASRSLYGWLHQCRPRSPISVKIAMTPGMVDKGEMGFRCSVGAGSFTVRAYSKTFFEMGVELTDFKIGEP